MATHRLWSVSLWRDPDDVPHCWILSPDKTEWRLISATLCGWRRCFVADQLWFMTRIREEEEDLVKNMKLIIHCVTSVNRCCRLYLGAVAYAWDSLLGRLFDTDADVGSRTALSASWEHVAWFGDVRRFWAQHFHGDTFPDVPVSAHH